MGRSLDLYSYDKEKLVKAIVGCCKTDDCDTVNRILDKFGTTVSGRYIILGQEFWEDYSCYYNVATVLDRVFKTGDAFGKAFCGNKSLTDRQEMIKFADIDEAMTELFGSNYNEIYPEREGQ